jgi:hypothetical protein
MSKQSRAKSRRHKKATAKKAPTFAEVVARMDEATKYYVKSKMKDELHDILCARQKYWGNKPLELFYCECWWQLTEEVMTKRSSKSRTRALEILTDIKVFYNYK